MSSAEYLLTSAALSAVLLVYPFVIYPLVSLALPTAEAVRKTGPRPRSAALMLCARNEAEALPRTLKLLEDIKAQWPDLQILVHDDASQDATPAVLETAIFLRTIRSETPVGKAIGMQKLIALSEAEVAILMDANVQFDPGALAAFMDYFRDPIVGAVGSRSVPSAGRSPSVVGRVYWALEEFVKRQETRTGSTMGCDGALWAVRRSLYPRFSAVESDDFRPSMEPLLQGRRVISAPEITVYEPAVPDAEIAARTHRIACGAWHAHRAIRTRVRGLCALDRFKYLSHKLVRWFAGLWLAVAAAGMLAGALVSGWDLVVAIGLLVFAAAVMLQVRPVLSVTRIGTGFLSTTAGVIGAMRGRGAATWSPARSV